MDSAQPNGKIDNATEDCWSKNTHREFCYDLSEEVGANWVHIVIHFSQEDRSFVREDKNNVLDGIERNSHGNKEESSISVLNALGCAISVLEENDGEDCSDNCNDQLNIGSLRKSDDV